MQIRFSDSLPDRGVRVIPVRGGAASGAIADLGADAAAALRAQRFEGESGATADLYPAGKRVLAIGIGDKATGEAAEKLGGAVVAKLLTSGESEAAIELSDSGFDAEDSARVALAAALRAWRHDRYRTKLKDKQKPSLATVTIVGAPAGAAKLYEERYAPLVAGVELTRELVAEPPNIIYPESFAKRVRESVEGTGLKVRVLGQAEMTALGMGALLGVAQGSVREPQLLVLEWNGGADGTPPIALVGKGVTFDTGGISIKPAAGMESMKWDMGGAGAVAGAMKAIAGRKAKANVVGICGLVENMPDGNAQRPGDVVTTMDGQTVEVINTDAEGRLVLADAITWVQREYKPRVIVDLATLTGAMVIALGHEYAGIFSNDDDLALQLIGAGDATGDKLWRQPLGDAYDRLIDSPIADMKNVGPREGGSITAAQFIKRFVGDGVKWAHLDIAGMAWSDKDCPTWAKGATGYGVRLLDRFVEDVAEG
ncbi:leucyl aminopeptidase [Sphingomonas sp. ASV193]|uniref:leucyl aminopeptidase n=1 Tax=Sphingomonas sp. ASV193 TaxID=3144405 RepID=UPI0032E87DAC